MTDHVFWKPADRGPWIRCEVLFRSRAGWLTLAYETLERRFVRSHVDEDETVGAEDGYTSHMVTSAMARIEADG